MKTSFTSSAETPAFLSAPLIAATPRSMAVKDERLPPKLPIGVRTAETIYTFCIGFDELVIPKFLISKIRKRGHFIRKRKIETA
jgi:hypothetical protein